MRRKEDTPARIARRIYEEKHRDDRIKATKVFGTSIPREFCDEINTFLAKHNLTKVDLISAGYCFLKERYEREEKKE